jgi:hypothetical protein
LLEVDRPLEAFDRHLFSVGKIDSVVNTGSHALADFFDSFEGGMKAELYDKFSAENSAESL